MYSRYLTPVRTFMTSSQQHLIPSSSVNLLKLTTSTPSFSINLTRGLATRAVPAPSTNIPSQLDGTYQIHKIHTASETLHTSKVSVQVGPYMSHDDIDEVVSPLPPPPASPAAHTYQPRAGIDTKPFATSVECDDTGCRVPPVTARQRELSNMAPPSESYKGVTMSDVERREYYDSEGFRLPEQVDSSNSTLVDHEGSESTMSKRHHTSTSSKHGQQHTSSRGTTSTLTHPVSSRRPFSTLSFEDHVQ